VSKGFRDNLSFNSQKAFITPCGRTELKTMSDKELDAVKNGDKTAFNGLAEKFLPLIKKETSDAVSRSDALKEHFDEIKQEALMALYDAALAYNGDKGVTFGLYAKICIHNRIISYVRKTVSQLKRAEKNRLSAEKSIKKSDAPEEMLLALEQNTELKRFLSENLSGLEKKVFTLYLEKKSYAEIAQLLGKEEKTVDNAIFRVKTKIKKNFY